MLSDFFTSFQVDVLVTTFRILFNTSMVWLPLLLFSMFLYVWLDYVRIKALIKNGGILLEIKLPREVFKTPLAMEVILTALHQSGNAEYLESFVKGKFRPWFSLEIVSIDGEVKFFIWTQPKFRKLIESQFYAQYPGVEIYEVEDYAKKVFWDPDNLTMFGAIFKLTKEDIYPIKTYVDYGLDKEQEEESKVDPMTSVLEFFGSMKAGEQAWLQIIIQAHRKTSLKSDATFHQKPDWKEAGEKKINELIEKYSKSSDEDGKRSPTSVQREIISALERSLSKFAFETTIRGIYLGRKESFDPIGISGLLGSFRQYSSNTLNGFKPAKTTSFDNPWDDFMGMRKATIEKKILNAYKLRSFFQVPYKYLGTKPFILTTEELATIFHLPGKVVGTPTLTKIQSRKSEAPSNLPI